MVFAPKYLQIWMQISENNNTIHIIIHLYVFLDFPLRFTIFALPIGPDGYYFCIFSFKLKNDLI